MDDLDHSEPPTQAEAGNSGESVTKNVSQSDDPNLGFSHRTEALFPEQMGRFQVVRQLGKGGFGTVYQAIDSELGREVAIKVANPDMRAPKFRRLYLQEARVLAQLDHPGIVPVFDVGEWPDGSIYVISKFIPGAKLTESLKARIGDFEFVATTLATVASAMAYAHSRRVVHRDLKPDNIMLDDRGQPIVVDFGLATGGNLVDMLHGRVGTRAYMSPEQARGESHRVDGRSDVYSLGVILYQFLTGKLPFTARNDEEQLRQFRDHDVIPPRHLQSRIPRELERICLKALSQRATDRHETADEFAEELRAWQVNQAGSAVANVAEGAAGQTVEAAGGKSQPSSGGSWGSRQRPLTDLVPRGLRSYGPEDSDFFLRMLPGPVGREGIPDSVWFWKLRIESRDVEQAFRVGVLFGESGSGKSSMIRAGVLPVLKDVETIVLESRPIDLAERLLRRLEQVADVGPLGDDIRTALLTVRDKMPEGRKLLIVLDQFEAYLHAADENAGWLAETLRQCDGVAVQALLLVREDFFREASSFMKAIEEPLQQNANFATIERFGKAHARRVLTGFGIALQAINPESPDWAAEKFVEQAVDALAEDGRVTPVRLAMLTEMMRETPWTPTTLRYFGGREGLEVAFLRECLTGAGAHPEFRRRPDLVRRILEALLPIESVSIRQHTVTAEEIIARGGMQENPEVVRELLRLLDREVRLITPAGSDESAWQAASAGLFSRSSAAVKSDSGASGLGPARYQLTHDHLVPSLRLWMAAEDESTWRGRNRLALRSASRRWSLDRGTGHLADPFSLAKWYLFTRRSDRNEMEREFLHASSRRLALLAAVVGAVGLGGGALVRSGLNERTRQGIVQAIRASDLRGLPALVSSAEDAKALEHLRRETLRAEQAGAVPPNFHWAGIATGQFEKHLPAVLEEAKGLRADQLRAAVELIRRVPADARQDFGRYLHGDDSRQRVATTALAAQLDPALKERFSADAAALLRELNALPLDELSQWLELLRPLQSAVTPRALQWLAQPDQTLRHDRVVGILLALVPASDVDALARLTTLLEPEELPALVDKVRQASDSADRETLVSALRGVYEELALDDRGASQSPAPLDATWLETIAAGQGVADGQCVIVPRLTHTDYQRLDTELRNQGYRLVSRRGDANLARAFQSAEMNLVAAVWVRDGRESREFGPWSSQELEQQAQQVTADGWLLEDVAPAGDSAGDGTRGWFVIASRPQSNDGSEPTNADSPNLLKRYEDPFAFQRDAKNQENSGYTAQRVAINPLENRAADIVVIWSPDNGAAEDRSYGADCRYLPVFTDWVPDATATDVRLFPAIDRSGRDLKLWAEFQAAAQARDLSSPKQWSVVMGKWLRDARRWDLLAQMDVGGLSDNEKAELEVLQATALLYQGELDAAQTLYQPHHGSPQQDPFWDLRVAGLTGNPEEVDQLLRTIPKPKDVPAETVAKVMGLRAGGASSGDRLDMLADQFLGLLQSQPEARQAAFIQSAVREPALDRLLEHPRVRQRLSDLGWVHLCCGTWQAHTDRRGKLQIGNLADAASELRGLRLAGYVPSCLESDGQRVVSAWQRPFTANSERRRAASLASLAVSVALLGEWDLVEQNLDEQAGIPVAEETLVALTAAGADPQRLVELLRQSLSRAVRRNALVGLADYSASQLKPSDQEFIKTKLIDWLNDENSGVAAAAKCLRQRWFPDLISTMDAGPRGGTRVRSRTSAPDGTTMVEVRPPERVWVGSYNFEPDRASSEKGAYMTGMNVFSIGQTETTVAQFSAFLRDEKVQSFYSGNPFDASKRFADRDDCPRTAVRLFDAIVYCQWLSEREGLPESEWCFPGIWDLAETENYRLPADVLSRTGYRLPTEVEWELAASEGSDTTWPTGWTERLVQRYAWTSGNSGGKSHPVASKLPNRFGLFDMLGNASEWCLEPFQAYRLPNDSSTLPWDSRFRRGAVWMKTGSASSSINFNVRGGSYVQSALRARPSSRVLSKPDEKIHYFGFRIARTLPQNGIAMGAGIP